MHRVAQALQVLCRRRPHLHKPTARWQAGDATSGEVTQVDPTSRRPDEAQAPFIKQKTTQQRALLVQGRKLAHLAASQPG